MIEVICSGKDQCSCAYNCIHAKPHKQMDGCLYSGCVFSDDPVECRGVV